MHSDTAQLLLQQSLCCASASAPQVSRDEYRQQRIQRYRNYMNVIPEDDCPAVRAELTAGWPQPTVLSDPQWPYAFLRNWRTVASSIVHFQLRNLLWAASAHDVAVVYDNRVQHWNSVTRSVTDVLDLRGWPKGPRLPGLSRVQVCSAYSSTRGYYDIRCCTCTIN